MNIKLIWLISPIIIIIGFLFFLNIQLTLIYLKLTQLPTTFINQLHTTINP